MTGLENCGLLFEAQEGMTLQEIIGWSKYAEGEIKKANDFKNQLKMSGGGLLVATILIVVLIITVDSVVGKDFNGSANYLYSTGQFPLPVAPYVGLFVDTAIPVALIAFVAFFFFNSFTWMNIVSVPLWNARVSMAMAFDRMLPEKMAKVSDRFRVPVINISVWVAASGLMFLLYYLVPSTISLFLTTALFSSLLFIGVALSGIALPLRRKTKYLYQGSPFSKYKFGAVLLLVCKVSDFLMPSLLSVVNNKISAESKTFLHFLIGTCGCNDRTTEHFANLNCYRTHSAPTSHDQNSLAWLNFRSSHKHVP